MNDLSHSIREVMDEEQTGEYLGKPPGTLRQWRYVGQGPPFVHVGRSVRYLKADVDAWLAENTTRPEALR